MKRTWERKGTISEAGWRLLELRVKDCNTIHVCSECCWYIFPFLDILLRILYNAFLPYLPPFPNSSQVHSLYRPLCTHIEFSLFLSSGPVCAAQLLLAVGPALECGQPTQDHIIKEYWLSLSQQLSYAHSFKLEIGFHAQFYPHTFCIARHHHPREEATYRIGESLFHLCIWQEVLLSRTYKEPKKLMIKKTHNPV